MWYSGGHWHGQSSTGLVVATFLTLIVAPSMYLIRYRLKLNQLRRQTKRILKEQKEMNEI